LGRFKSSITFLYYLQQEVIISTDIYCLLIGQVVPIPSAPGRGEKRRLAFSSLTLLIEKSTEFVQSRSQATITFVTILLISMEYIEMTSSILTQLIIVLF
jgi:hypothetical protein